MRGRTQNDGSTRRDLPHDYWGVVLDSPDGPALARFYAELLGWQTGPGRPRAHPTRRGCSSGTTKPTAERWLPRAWRPISSGGWTEQSRSDTPAAQAHASPALPQAARLDDHDTARRATRGMSLGIRGLLLRARRGGVSSAADGGYEDRLVGTGANDRIRSRPRVHDTPTIRPIIPPATLDRDVPTVQPAELREPSGPTTQVTISSGLHSVLNSAAFSRRSPAGAGATAAGPSRTTGAHAASSRHSGT